MPLQEFKKRVDGIMNIIFAGGLANHTAIIEFMIYLVFLRELHKHDQEQKLLSKNYEPILGDELAIYQWDNLLSLNSDALFAHLNEAFEKLSQQTTNKTVQLLYSKAHVKLFDKAALRAVVHRIEEMMQELEKEEKKNRTDFFGDLYEYLLSKISAAGTGGQFRTPRHIIRFMVDAIAPEAGESICDPACGTGGFLVAALEHLKNKYTSDEFKKRGRYPLDLLTEKQRKFLYNQAFSGFDSDPDMIKFGLMNLYFHHLENATVRRRNTLTETAGETTKWDVILANPPFAGKIDRGAVAEEIQMNTGATEVLFLNYMIRHLTDRGRCGVIAPEGVINNGDQAHIAVRKKLVEEAGLWAVVSLPAGVFNPYSGVKTSILFFDKTRKNTNSEIAFIKISNDGFDLGAKRRPISHNDFPKALKILDSWKKGKKTENEFGLFIEKARIAASREYNLSGDRYRAATDYTNAKWPMVKLGDVCDVYQPKTITSNEIKEYGKYKVFGANGVIGYFDKYNHEDAEVAVTCRGATCGTVNLTEPRSWITGNAMVIKPKKNSLNKRYLYFLLRGTDLSSVITGAAQPQITGSAFKPFLIPLPPLEIQEQIVTELEGYQNIITGARQIVQNWKPKIDKDPMWEKVKLVDIINLVRGVVYSKADEVDSDGSQILRAMNITLEGILLLDDVKLVSRKLKLKDQQKLRKGDIFICLASGSKDHIGKVAYIEQDMDFYFGGFMGSIRVNNEKAVPRFIYFCLRDGAFNDYLRGAISGANINNLNTGILGRFEIPLPSLEVQKRIVEKIEAERSLVESAKKLIEIYDKKTKETIAKLWNE